MSISGKTQLVEGKPTYSVEDHDEIKKILPLTYSMPILTFEPSNLAERGQAINVGVMLSGGQALGGHNVISGIFDGIKSKNKKTRNKYSI